MFLNRNVSLLALCVCLMMSCSALNVAVAALVGFALADDKAFSTLPLAMQFIATMVTTIPAATLMHYLGRKRSFLIGTLFGIAGGFLGSYAIVTANFWLFTAATSSFGIFLGFANYFRYAAAESVEIAYRSRAISFVMLGGVLAAIIGPSLARYSREWIAGAEFAGSYAATILLYSLILAALAFLKLDRDRPRAIDLEGGGRSLGTIVSQPRYIVSLVCGMLGYGVMVFVMTATPLAMERSAYMFDETSLVIQWHVLAMFAPSFITGNLIVRFGVLRVMAIGAGFGIVCVVVNLMGTGLPNFLLALVALGISWNFLFVGSTTMITETYRPEEKSKAQAVNDFAVFSTVALASLSAGAMLNTFGWQAVNLGILPLLLVVLLSIAWLRYREPERRAKTSAGIASGIEP